MVLGSLVRRWGTREELRQAIGTAQPLRRSDEYGSGALRIKRVDTRTVGVYFIVTEADVLFPEDWDALYGLDRELRAPWRNRVVESDFYGHPHRWFPVSSNFRIHVVHPGMRAEWRTVGQIHQSSAYGAFRFAG